MIHFNIFEGLKRLEKPFSFMILQICSINTEAVVPRRPVKMVFLTVSENSQESICVGVSY